MEEKTNQKRKALRTVLVSGAVIIAAGSLWHYVERNQFCFDFVHNTQFGDNATLENPSNQAFIGPRGVAYYIPETPALQKALEKEGFYIDEFEMTGGGVYLDSFFGPSTKTAVIEFQKRYSIEPTGIVDNDTIDALREIYGCSAPKTATSTPEASATSTQE